MVETNKSKYELKLKQEKEEAQSDKRSGETSTKNTDRKSLPLQRTIQ